MKFSMMEYSRYLLWHFYYDICTMQYVITYLNTIQNFSLYLPKRTSSDMAPKLTASSNGFHPPLLKDSIAHKKLFRQLKRFKWSDLYPFLGICVFWLFLQSTYRRYKYKNKRQIKRERRDREGKRGVFNIVLYLFMF